MIMGESNVREGWVVSEWEVENRWGWDEKGKGFMMEDVRIVEKKEIRSVEG